jgi:hypothetical protein
LQVIAKMNTHGMLKHPRVDIFDIMRRDLQAISDALGDKKYILGGDHPTLVMFNIY